MPNRESVRSEADLRKGRKIMNKLFKLVPMDLCVELVRKRNQELGIGEETLVIPAFTEDELKQLPEDERAVFRNIAEMPLAPMSSVQLEKHIQDEARIVATQLVSNWLGSLCSSDAYENFPLRLDDKLLPPYALPDFFREEGFVSWQELIGQGLDLSPEGVEELLGEFANNIILEIRKSGGIRLIDNVVIQEFKTGIWIFCVNVK